MITIYVIQKAGTDITVRHPPLTDCISIARALPLVRYLGWDYWIWGYEDLKDFEADDRGPDDLEKGELWTLLVPRQQIKWCNLSALREGRTPVWSWFFADPDSIRKKGATPLAFIKAPIKGAWVSKKAPAKPALIKTGILQETSKP